LRQSISFQLSQDSGVPAYLRLRLDIPYRYHLADDDFQDNIVVSSQPDGKWRFWWPWAHPIAPADDISGTVGEIYGGNEPGLWDYDNATADEDETPLASSADAALVCR
jgi:hypothetical protein